MTPWRSMSYVALAFSTSINYRRSWNKSRSSSEQGRNSKMNMKESTAWVKQSLHLIFLFPKKLSALCMYIDVEIYFLVPYFSFVVVMFSPKSNQSRYLLFSSWFILLIYSINWLFLDTVKWNYPSSIMSTLHLHQTCMQCKCYSNLKCLWWNIWEFVAGKYLKCC